MIDNKNKWLTQNVKGMKKLVFLFASMFMLVLAAEKISAQTGDVTAVITTDIGISQSQALSFGSIAPGDAESVIRISTSGTLRTLISGNATLNSTNDGLRGLFDVSGTPNAGDDITLPGSPVTLTATTGEGAGSATMTVGNFASSPATSSTIGSTGSSSITVGADLTVAASQVSGDYAGTYTITVEYQ
jgi:Mat/Ecp fimbriae major subunit